MSQDTQLLNKVDMPTDHEYRIRSLEEQMQRAWILLDKVASIESKLTIIMWLVGTATSAVVFQMVSVVTNLLTP